MLRVTVAGGRRLRRDNRLVNRLPALLCVFLVAPAYAAKLTDRCAAAFDRYVALTEARTNADLTPDRFLRIASPPDARAALRAGQTRIQPSVTLDNGKTINVPGGMIQDWVGAMFIPGATIAHVKAVLQDYAHYQDFYQPEVTESKQIGQKGDEFDVFLRLSKKQVITVVLDTNYHVRYSLLDARHMYVVSHSTRIAQVKDPKHPDAGEDPVGNDLGTLGRINAYWRFEEADSGVYAECEAISLSRDVPGLIAWMVRGFVEKFPKESMQNTLRGTQAAVIKQVELGPRVGRH